MAGRSRAHVLSLRDPQPPILGRAPMPPAPHPALMDDPRLLSHRPPPLGPHPSLIIEERLTAQMRDIHELLLDNQRLAATHVALKQEVDATQHELRVSAASATKANAEKDAEVRELYERALRVEADARLVERMREELALVRADVRELAGVREELMQRMQGLKMELTRSRNEVHQAAALQAEIDTMKIEIQKGRAAVDYEKKAHAANLEQSQSMERNVISMARELDKLKAELADAEKRARAAAAASVANPGPAYAAGGYGNPEMAYGGTSYANNAYGMQQVQRSAGAAGAQYGSAAASHVSYDMQHGHMNR